MKKLLFAVIATAILSSCGISQSNNPTTISGRFVGSNVDSVFLERVSDNFASLERIDGVKLADNGGFSFEFDVEEGASPRFYKLTFSGATRPVTLVVNPGDNISLESAGDIFLNYEVEAPSILHYHRSRILFRES